MDKRLHIIVKGRVQGVGFRYFILNKSKQIQITGFIRNLADGSVEIVAEGSDQALDKTLCDVKKGPSMSHVTECYSQFSDATNEFFTFTLLK